MKDVEDMLSTTTELESSMYSTTVRAPENIVLDLQKFLSNTYMSYYPSEDGCELSSYLGGKSHEDVVGTNIESFAFAKSIRFHKKVTIFQLHARPNALIPKWGDLTVVALLHDTDQYLYRVQLGHLGDLDKEFKEFADKEFEDGILVKNMTYEELQEFPLKLWKFILNSSMTVYSVHTEYSYKSQERS